LCESNKDRWAPFLLLLRLDLLTVVIYDNSLNISTTNPTFEIVRKQQGSVGSIFCCSSASISSRSLSTTILSIFPLPTRLSDLSGSKRNQLRPFGALISHRPARRPLFKAFRDDCSFRAVRDPPAMHSARDRSPSQSRVEPERDVSERQVAPNSRHRQLWMGTEALERVEFQGECNAADWTHHRKLIGECRLGRALRWNRGLGKSPQ
jgi:hypothetical protein